jgi:membrane protease YdiL (CAAX protease family)
MSSWNFDDRRGLMNAAVSFYAGVLIVSGLVWWASGIDLRSQLFVDRWAIPLGIVGVVPMLPVLFIARALRELVTQLLGRPLSRCRLGDLVVLATLAGIGEELLFRGALQVWWSGFGALAGLVGANLVFGGLHALTPMYFVIATAFGFYLSGLAEVGADRNLVPPMITHAVYDFIGFVMIVRAYNERAPDEGAGDSGSSMSSDAAP